MLPKYSESIVLNNSLCAVNTYQTYYKEDFNILDRLAVNSQR